MSQAQYHQLIHRVRSNVQRALPRDSTVLVASRGDGELLRLDERQALHFPQVENGVYAGDYPANSTAAIAHLESLRDRGAEFVVFPQTALWWLDHYAELGSYLETHCAEVLRQDDTCREIFALTSAAEMRALRAQAAHLEQRLHLLREDIGRREHGERIREIVQTALPRSARVLVAARSERELPDLDGRRMWPFPQLEPVSRPDLHPATSAEVIARLEALRTEGADYFLVPMVAFWWLDHYGDVRHHVETFYRCVWRDTCCVIYQLSEANPARLPGRSASGPAVLASSWEREGQA